MLALLDNATGVLLSTTLQFIMQQLGLPDKLQVTDVLLAQDDRDLKSFHYSDEKETSFSSQSHSFSLLFHSDMLLLSVIVFYECKIRIHRAKEKTALSGPCCDCKNKRCDRISHLCVSL